MLFTLFVYLHSQSHAKHAGNLKSSAQFQQSRFNTTKICHTISNGLMLIEHIEMNYFLIHCILLNRLAVKLWASLP